MKNAEEFRSKLSEWKRSSTEKDNDVICRVPSEKIIPMIATYMDEVISFAEESRIWEQEDFDRSTIKALAVTINSVADLSASKSYNREERQLNDEDVAIFAEIFKDLDALRGEVFESYAKNAQCSRSLDEKVTEIGRVIRGGSVYGLCGDHIIVHGFSNIQKLVRYMNEHWEELEARCSVSEMLFEFKRFRNNYRKSRHASYTEDELFELLYGLLDGSKKFSKPVRVYEYKGNFSMVIDYDAPDIPQKILVD